MTWNEKWMWRAIALYIASVVGIYVINLHDFPFSKSPSDWGTIGDYFGGLINPLTSLIALYFLIKAYLSQKEELSATVAVGMAVTCHPPHRSVRAELPHTAPASGT